MDNPSKFTVQPSDKTLAYWLNQDFIPQAVQQELKKANVLITPRARYGTFEGWHFPHGTEDIFQFLRNRNESGALVDICIDDKDFKELSLHSDILTLPDFILVTIAAPVIAGLIVEYIKYRLGSRLDKTTIKTNITVTDEKHSVKLSYEGNANDFDKIVGQTLRLVDSPQVLDRLEETIDLEYEERIRRLTDGRTDDGE